MEKQSLKKKKKWESTERRAKYNRYMTGGQINHNCLLLPQKNENPLNVFNLEKKKKRKTDMMGINIKVLCECVCTYNTHTY